MASTIPGERTRLVFGVQRIFFLPSQFSPTFHPVTNYGDGDGDDFLGPVCLESGQLAEGPTRYLPIPPQPTTAACLLTALQRSHKTEGQKKGLSQKELRCIESHPWTAGGQEGLVQGASSLEHFQGKQTSHTRMVLEQTSGVPAKNNHGPEVAPRTSPDLAPAVPKIPNRGAG